MVTERKVVHQSFTNFNWPCQFGLNWKNFFIYIFYAWTLRLFYIVWFESLAFAITFYSDRRVGLLLVWYIDLIILSLVTNLCNNAIVLL